MRSNFLRLTFALPFLFQASAHAVRDGIEHAGKSFERDGFILNTDNKFCQATLYNEVIGITAGHCRTSAEEFYLKSLGKRIKVKEWRAHPDYDPSIENRGNDIALFLLVEPIREERQMRKLYLPEKNPPLQMSGRVFTGEHGPLLSTYFPDSRRVTPYKMRSQIGKSPNLVGPHFTVLDVLEVEPIDGSNPRICFGDSGGGFTMEVDNKTYLTGIISRVNPKNRENEIKKCESSDSLFLTSVAFHADWIKRTASELEQGVPAFENSGLLKKLLFNWKINGATYDFLPHWALQNMTSSEEESKKLGHGFPSQGNSEEMQEVDAAH